MCKYQTLCKGAIVILIWNGFSALAAVYDSDGSSTNVQSIHDTLAQNGDTITLPASTFTWSGGVNITKAITLQGTGVGSTAIRDNVQSGSLIRVALVAGAVTRITGIDFQDGGRVNTTVQGAIKVDGSNTNGSQFRFDHNAWNRVKGNVLCDTVIGVIDHNAFTMFDNSSTVTIYGSHWNGGNYGDGASAAPTGFGSSQFLFIEDNVWFGVRDSRLCCSKSRNGKHRQSSRREGVGGLNNRQL
jgi:hypothetical protein